MWSVIALSLVRIPHLFRLLSAFVSRFSSCRPFSPLSILCSVPSLLLLCSLPATFSSSFLCFLSISSSYYILFFFSLFSFYFFCDHHYFFLVCPLFVLRLSIVQPMPPPPLHPPAFLQSSRRFGHSSHSLATPCRHHFVASVTIRRLRRRHSRRLCPARLAGCFRLCHRCLHLPRFVFCYVCLSGPAIVVVCGHCPTLVYLALSGHHRLHLSLSPALSTLSGKSAVGRLFWLRSIAWPLCSVVIPALLSFWPLILRPSSGVVAVSIGPVQPLRLFFVVRYDCVRPIWPVHCSGACPTISVVVVVSIGPSNRRHHCFCLGRPSSGCQCPASPPFGYRRCRPYPTSLHSAIYSNGLSGVVRLLRPLLSLFGHCSYHSPAAPLSGRHPDFVAVVAADSPAVVRSLRRIYVSIGPVRSSPFPFFIIADFVTIVCHHHLSIWLS